MRAVIAVFIALVTELSALPYIIIKADDVKAHWPFVTSQWSNYAQFMMTNGLHCTMGLIGDESESYGNTYPYFWDWLNYCGSNGIEVWNHGFVHNAFSDNPYDHQRWNIIRNHNLVLRKSGTAMQVFGAPQNMNDNNTQSIMDDLDGYTGWFFGITNGTTFVYQRFGDMEYPTLVPNYASFMSNYTNMMNKSAAAGCDYIALQGHPQSWTTERYSNFMLIVNHLKSNGHIFVTPREYVNIKTGNMTITAPSPQSIFTPGQSVTATAAGTGITWNIERVSNGTATSVASASGSSCTFTVPADAAFGEYIRISLRAGGFTLRQSHHIFRHNGVNLANGKTFTASSGAASPAGDGSLASSWISAASDAQWLAVDLGDIIPIGSASITWLQNRFANRFRIDVSHDAVTWSEVFSNDIGTGGISYAPFVATNARYVRFRGIERIDMNNGYGISEFAVYADGGLPQPGAAVTVTAEADAQVHKQYPDANYGTNANMEVIYSSTGERQSYLRFDISIVTQAAQQATLAVYLSTKGAAMHGAYLVEDNTWGENTITWNNKPLRSLQLGTNHSANVWRTEFDVTDAVNAARTNGNKFSVVLVGTTGTYTSYRSRENTVYGTACRPSLFISYAADIPVTNTNTAGTNTAAVTNAVLDVPRSMSKAYVLNNPCRGGNISFMDLIPGTTVHVYTLSGRSVAVLPDTARTGLVVWDVNAAGRRPSPGVYLCTLRSGTEMRAMKVMLLR